MYVCSVCVFAHMDKIVAGTCKVTIEAALIGCRRVIRQPIRLRGLSAAACGCLKQRHCRRPRLDHGLSTGLFRLFRCACERCTGALPVAAVAVTAASVASSFPNVAWLSWSSAGAVVTCPHTRTCVYQVSWWLRGLYDRTYSNISMSVVTAAKRPEND